jgi:tetratricopeptide (TPR) repeat protein/transcriptional regulator with XRE-family HTH domain
MSSTTSMKRKTNLSLNETPGTRGLSPFAQAVRRLLDDTAYFTRPEWARFLGVSPPALSQWVNDKTLPRADLLRVILDVLRSSADIPPEPLAEFDRIASRPAQEVSPLGRRMLPTVNEYLNRSTFVRLGNELRKLLPEQQQRVLAEGSWESGTEGENVAPLEMYGVEDFRDWLTAGYKDLARPDTRARAFAPLHLLVGHGDITNELNSVYDVLSGGAQILFRRGLADAIAVLPTEANAVPVLRALLHLAGRIKALEVLPKLTPQVGAAGFFGMPDRDEGRELFALALDVVVGMTPAFGTADTLRNFMGSVFFRPGYAPLALVALCRAEPERFTQHVSLLRGYFANLHTDHGVGNAAITARRVAQYVPLNVMASSLKALELAVVIPDNDRWLVDALFVGEESPLEINIEQGIISRRGGEGREPVQFPEGTEEAREFRSQLQDLIFENALERLPEDLRKPNEVPTVVRLTEQNYGPPPSKSVKRMSERLSKEKDVWFARELPWDLEITRAERELRRDEIRRNEIDPLRTRLVEVLRDIPQIWDTCQEEIAEFVPVSDISRVFRDWRKEYGLQALASDLGNCRSYKTLRRYNHPLLEIEKLAARIEEPRLDPEAIEQVVWSLLNGCGKPGAERITQRLTEGLQPAFPELAEFLQDYAGKHSRELSFSARCLFYRAAEHLVANVPKGRTPNRHFQVQDLAWRAVLLDKARQLDQAAGLAAQALDLAASMLPGPNGFMWWTRLGDANRIVARASGRIDDPGWGQCIDAYDAALNDAHEGRYPMVYLRQAEALADRLTLFGGNPSVDAAKEMCVIAGRGCDLAKKAGRYASDAPTVPLFMEARHRAFLASALSIAMPAEAAVAEEEVETTVETILGLSPNHTGAIWLAWRLYDEKGDEDRAIRWLDGQVERLRETHDLNNRNVLNYLEFHAARYMLDLGRQDEARQRFQTMVTKTQPNNPEARRELSRIGLDPSQEHLAQQLYREARSLPPGSQERRDRATETLERNQPLVDADPDMKDAVPWTRHARSLLLIDEIDKALPVLEKLRAKYPHDPYVWFHLGEGLYRKGVVYETGDQSNQAREKYEEATTAFEKAWVIEKRVDTADRLAACWTRRKNVGEAKRVLSEAEKLDPEDGRTKFSLGWAHYRAGELDQALRYWLAALQCFGEAESLSEREETLARQAANAVVRFAEKPMATKVPLNHLGSSALRTLISAARSAGWNCSKIVESMGDGLDSLPPHARGRVPHALRAHLLYLQLAEGNEAAYQWHKRWFEKLAEVDDPKLFFEYAAGGKDAFRRAVLWCLAKNCSEGSYRVPNMPDVVLDEERWGDFLRVASTWGPREDYYQQAYSAWPTGRVSRDELWDVVRQLSAKLFQAALNEVGLDLTRLNPANSLEGANNLPIEPEILPANELYPEAPDSLLVQTDEYSSCILLSSSLSVVRQHAVSEVKKHWDIIPGKVLRLSVYDGAGVPETEVKSLKFLASRSGSEVTINEQRGLDLTWRIWPQDAALLS